MPFASFARHIAETAHRLAGANGGNIAVLFAIALLPILGFIGAAIDDSRASKSRSSMQAAPDSAALMLSKDLASGTHLDLGDLHRGTGLLHSALCRQGRQNISINATYTAENGGMGSTIQLTGSGQIATVAVPTARARAAAVVRRAAHAPYVRD